VTRYIALLRGINVGGHNRVPMAALRTICESIGCTNVATYIQSGNVVLTSTLGPAELGSRLESAISDALGVSPAVMIRTAQQFAAVPEANPFPEADPATLHVLFLTTTPDTELVAGLSTLDSAPEELAVRGTEVYFHLPNGLGRAKLPELYGRRIKIPGTMRNWRTVIKLVDMSANE
jgi:uncharacterized protein (DUF1697 family)